MTEEHAVSDPDAPPRSRMQLVWEVLVFQLKLAADGFRDLLLVPVSLVAAFFGLIAGGDRPDRYYRRVLLFGRRTEEWINLFGYRKHKQTSDQLLAPLQEKVFSHVENNPTLQRASTELNKHLDGVNAALQPKDQPPTDPAPRDSTKS